MRADEHQNEFVPPHAERLAWLTGFSGSAGLAAILADRWGSDAGRRLGILHARFDRIVDTVGGDADQMLAWAIFEGLTPEESAVVLDRLAG